MRNEKILVVGLGYVGLPVALAFAKEYADVVGFDISEQRVRELRDRIDRTHEVNLEELAASTLRLTSNLEDVGSPTFVVGTVPTPIDDNYQPDLRPLRSASETVGRFLSEGTVVVYESTVYPGVTEEVCRPILERVSGLPHGAGGFQLGYSPERINPGDKKHTLATTVKVVAGDDDATLARVAAAYERIVSAGVHRAPSIRVAEAAKVIENTQRDLNIALMNELSLIFDRLGIRTPDVLAAAGTKWNFLPFSPGLVGGHCIGVDPYYLTSKAQSVGYHPEVILAGRRINDGMGAFVAQKLVKLLLGAGVRLDTANVAVLGLTFKEDVSDLWNSRVPDVLAELEQYGLHPSVHDPLASAEEAMHEYGVTLAPLEGVADLDAVVVAVPHAVYAAGGAAAIRKLVRPGGVVVDVKSMLSPAELPGYSYWSL